MGDSAITETVWLGWLYHRRGLGILSLVGGTPEEAMEYTREMRTITTTTHPTSHARLWILRGHLLALIFAKWFRQAAPPIIDTAIAHKDPGYPKSAGDWCAPRWNASGKR